MEGQSDRPLVVVSGGGGWRRRELAVEIDTGAFQTVCQQCFTVDTKEACASKIANDVDTDGPQRLLASTGVGHFGDLVVGGFVKVALSVWGENEVSGPKLGEGWACSLRLLTVGAGLLRIREDAGVGLSAGPSRLSASLVKHVASGPVSPPPVLFARSIAVRYLFPGRA